MSSNYRETMLETMESIIKKVKPNVEVCEKYEDMVNEITHKEARLSRFHITSDEAIQRCCIELCEKIIESRLSQQDKVFILSMIGALIEYSESGGYLTALTDNGIAWDDYVRRNADERIEKFNKRWGKNK